MAAVDLYDETRRVLEAVGKRLGVPVDNAELLHLHSNASYLLPSIGWVVRIATNLDALVAVAQSVRVTRWLNQEGFPSVAPAAVDQQPFVEAGRVVSIWQYVPTTDASPTGADLGRVLRRLHEHAMPPEPPAALTDPLGSVRRALQQAPEALPPDSRDWLVNRIAELERRWATLEFPHSPGLIHGDAHPGNLLATATGQTMLGDWDHVAVGPREWDLAQVHYTHRRFGTPSADDLDGFAEAYGWDIRNWSDLDAVVAVRDVSGLSAFIRTATTKAFSREELRERVKTLQAGDASARWRRP